MESEKINDDNFMKNQHNLEVLLSLIYDIKMSLDMWKDEPNVSVLISELNYKINHYGKQLLK